MPVGAVVFRVYPVGEALQERLEIQRLTLVEGGDLNRQEEIRGQLIGQVEETRNVTRSGGIGAVVVTADEYGIVKVGEP
jgi:thiamine monophosphate kinase